MKLLNLMLIASLIAVSACNTIEGAGKDLKAGGEAVKDTARENKNY